MFLSFTGFYEYQESRCTTANYEPERLILTLKISSSAYSFTYKTLLVNSLFVS